MKDLILIGGGGHSKSVIDSIEGLNKYNIVGILDLKDKIGSKINGVKVIGEDKDLKLFYEAGIQCAFVTVGSIGESSLREKLFNRAKDAGFNMETIIDRTAIISTNVQIGEGTFVGKGSIINTNALIGKNCVINTGTIIEHDCHVEDSCHIAPGVTLSGGVKVGHFTHIGTNSTVIQNITIGANTLIGAGSVVVKNIESYKKAFGNPCREVF